ncbi:class E sortase [Streptosporangium sp. NPDC020072]|uniref:class E sortase n=1 Tax=Streptosporangium sp. NPDC020072 TaxID=3154788 RepID=UPI0034317DC1
MRAILRVSGEVSMTAGVVVLFFCAYLLWGTGSYTARRQAELREGFRAGLPALTALLGAPPAVPPATGVRPVQERLPAWFRKGDALALLRIPRFGADYEYAVVEGVGWDQLRTGPGHYPGTALPGEVGNFVLSGHRTTYAAPFNRLGELRRGDEIVVETRQAGYTYRVTGERVVDPGQVDVIAPVPGVPGRRPTKAVITLSTCHPEYSAAQRLIVSGELVRREDRRG